MRTSRPKAKIYKVKYTQTRYDRLYPWRMFCCGITIRAYGTWPAAMHGLRTHNQLKHSRLRKL